jgi:hypothetical protein
MEYPNFDETTPDAPRFTEPFAPDDPVTDTATVTSDGQRITDGLEARYRFPENERLVTATLNNGVVVHSPVIVEATLPDHPAMQLRFEAEEGKFLITRFELVRSEGGGAINAAAVRDLPLAPVFKAIRARLVTAFDIMGQLTPRVAAPAPPVTIAEERPVRETRFSSVPRLDEEPPREDEVITPRPITRPAGRHLAHSSEPADLDLRRAERSPRFDEPPHVADGV